MSPACFTGSTLRDAAERRAGRSHGRDGPWTLSPLPSRKIKGSQPHPSLLAEAVDTQPPSAAVCKMPCDGTEGAHTAPLSPGRAVGAEAADGGLGLGSAGLHAPEHRFNSKSN